MGTSTVDGYRYGLPKILASAVVYLRSVTVQIASPLFVRGDAGQPASEMRSGYHLVRERTIA
jgi:hypothetical protein